MDIINELKSKADKIQVMPVIFMKGKSEVTSRSFPFNFEIRKKMLDSIFGDSILISRNYCFFAPFSRYMPPILSRNSWKLKKQILQGVEDDYFSYTGDKAEGYMLKIYRLKPKVGIRKEVSAASVKNKLYDSVNGLESNWKDDVPAEVAKIIEENWSVVKKFANSEDMTTKVAGMKFPKEGWSK